MRNYLMLGAIVTAVLVGVYPSRAADGTPEMVAYISTQNMVGALKYCADKGLTDKSAHSSMAETLTKTKVSDEMVTTGEQARAIGERGVLFTFGGQNEKPVIPVITIEALAQKSSSTVKEICDTYAKATLPSAK
ncbi:hypothetical protein [Ochrobactrum sp. SFR4]|uniref:hypothetical protein n=1 Tax=Ochrobactrum sp. SFR4 TaxID=2717368 RepID=UPI001C8BC014|nr:hypothetical protein [Ochrobactrum sp. SFR4]MBX8827377.1 hypothetical protein [Ochrobactrum sp. SFR4]